MSHVSVRIRVEVDAGSPAERMVAEWLRAWRRRGAQRSGKTLYPHQGALKAFEFRAPREAVEDLERRLDGRSERHRCAGADRYMKRVASPQVIVQTIHTRWCDCVRHAASARARSAVPRILPLPALPAGGDRAALVWHEVRYDHRDRLDVTQSVRLYEGVARTFGQISVERDGAVVLVRLRGRTQCRVAEGERAAILYSFREEIGLDGWVHDFYSRVAFHLAYGVRWDSHVLYAKANHDLDRLRDLR